MQYISNIAILVRNLSILANFSYLDNFCYNCKITFLSAEIFMDTLHLHLRYLSILNFDERLRRINTTGITYIYTLFIPIYFILPMFL